MIPLFKVHMPNDLRELNDILFSGSLGYGEWSRKFEDKVAELIDNKRFLSVNSYTSAMLIAIDLMNLNPGDEVIASPMSCLASNQPAITKRIKIIWGDVDPLTGTLDPQDVEKKITTRTKAIFHNHHCGYVGYVNDINYIARKQGIYVLNDAIEAFGSQYDGKMMGNIDADITVFSFHTVRLPNTIEGGGLSFRDEELFSKAQLIRDLGINRSRFRNRAGEISQKCDVSLPGYGATLNDLHGYIGLRQFDEIVSLLNQQRRNGTLWDESIRNMETLLPLQIVENSIPNYWVYGVLAKNKNKTINHFRLKGFYASGVHLPNYHYSIFGNKISLKGVEEFYQRFVALPSGWWISSIVN